jgi:hypothetical protein
LGKSNKIGSAVCAIQEVLRGRRVETSGYQVINTAANLILLSFYFIILSRKLAESIEAIFGRSGLQATPMICNITGAIEVFDHLNHSGGTQDSSLIREDAKDEKNMRLVSKGINKL